MEVKEKYKIRTINLGEFATILSEASEHYGSHYGGYWKIDPAVALNAWRKWLSDSSYVLIGMFNEEAGELMGIIGGQITYDPYHYSGILEGHERMWFVRSKYRSTGAGIQLLRAFEEWSKDRGAKRIVMAFMCGHKEEAMISLFERCGYKVMQTSVAKEV